MLATILATTLLAAVPAGAPTCIAPDGAQFTLELATDDRSRALGLMFRDKLQYDRGMLFIFPADDIYPFWMRHTYFPLDLIWLDATGKVVEVRQGAQPCLRGDCPQFTPSAKARAVLEINGGLAESHGIKPGATLKFEHVPNFPVATAAQ